MRNYSVKTIKIGKKTYLIMQTLALLVLLLINPLLTVVITDGSYATAIDSSEESMILETSDVAGNEIYAEQISAYVAGGASLIRQSYVTNDTNIYRNFDYNDPGFIECSLMISASNGINPRMFPAPLGNDLFSSTNLYSTEPFFGFLYYNSSSASSNVTITSRAHRAIDIIESSFGLELIMLDNQNNVYWYPFIAYYADWNNVIPFITEHAPQDGYIGALDTERLQSEYYLENYHISATILMLNSMKLLTQGIALSEQYFNFDLRDIAFSFMEMDEISSLFGSLLGMGGAGGSMAGLGSFDVSSFLNSNEKVLTSLIQYEGHPSGIIKDGNRYRFDLMKAMDYDVSKNGPLQPSEKIFVGLMGALLSGIDISIFSADVISTTPNDFKFSDYLLDTLETAVFLLDQDIDITMIENYSIGAFWENEGSVNRLTANIHNLIEPEDPVNLIRLLGIPGVPMIPTGILNPISELKINFAVNGSEPALTVKKDFNLIDLSTGDYRINITAENRGNTTVWGKDLSDVFDITEFIPVPGGIEPFIQILHPELTVEEYLGLDQNPKFFFIDTFGSGFYDSIYPNFLNLSMLEDLSDFENAEGLSMFDLINFDMLSLYAPQLVDDIITFGLFGATEDDREYYEGLYANPNSIMNPDNWKLDPGEELNYTTGLLSLLPFYDYYDYYTFNFTYDEGIEPLLYRGEEIDGTTAFDAKLMDGEYWNISSSQVGAQYLTQIYFTFRNSSSINTEDNNLDRLHLEMKHRLNITEYNDVSLSFYNYSLGEYGGFEEAQSTDITFSNTSLIYNAYSNLTNYFDEENNYTCIFKMTLDTFAPSLLSIDSLNLTISDRNLTITDQNAGSVSYSSKTGVTNYKANSNSYQVATDHAPLLRITAQLNKQNAEPGDARKITFQIQNKGDRNATAVNLTIGLPAKIKTTGSFDNIANGSLYWTGSKIEAGESVSLWFEFYTPNSLMLPVASLNYNSESIIDPEQADFEIEVNDLFISAPVSYNWGNKEPYTDMVEITYTTNYTDAFTCSGVAPQVGDHVQLNITVKNVQTVPINDLKVVIPQYFGDFECISTEGCEITNLIRGFPQKVKVLLNKTRKGAVLHPGIDRFLGSQSDILQFERPDPLILGYGCLELDKKWSDEDGIYENKVDVIINITNSGNIIYENITVNDVWGFPKRGFYLFEGRIDHAIRELKPGESYSYSYTLKFRNQGLYNISGAKIEYFYLTEKTSESNMLTIKVRNLWIVNALWIMIPAAACLVATAFIYWWKHRYDLEAAQFQRREELMFGQDLRSTAWDKYIIEEHLQALMRGEEISSTRKREEVL